jgi:ankyrin repeat protein
VAQVCGADNNDSRRRHYWYSAPALPYEKRERDALDVLQLLLELSGPDGNGLEMLNGAGDTCLHTAIMHHHVAVAKALIDFKPSLLYRENAVGRTPAEVAYDAGYYHQAHFVHDYTAVTRITALPLLADPPADP